jgi:hypothetical protein
MGRFGIAEPSFAQGEASPSFFQEMSHEVDGQAHSLEFIRPKSSGEGTPRDEFERNLLDRFGSSAQRSNDLVPEFQGRLSGDSFDYYEPLRAKQSCDTCHLALGSIAGQPSAGLKEGDLMAIAKVSVPAAEFLQARNRNRAVLLSTGVVATFLAMLSTSLVLRYTLRKSLGDLLPKVS